MRGKDKPAPSPRVPAPGSGWEPIPHYPKPAIAFSKGVAAVVSSTDLVDGLWFWHVSMSRRSLGNEGVGFGPPSAREAVAMLKAFGMVGGVARREGVRDRAAHFWKRAGD